MHVLIIEDEYALAAALSTVVRRLGAEPTVAASGQSGLEKVGKRGFEVVLLDIGLPDMSGLSVLQQLRAMPAPPTVLVITAHGTLETALEARRLGAHDYFLKPLNLGEMQACLRGLMPATIQEKAAPVSTTNGKMLMIGAAPGMQRAFTVVAQACATAVPVLLSGPRGAGKTLAAEVIHRHGGCPTGPLVAFRADEWPEAEQERALRQGFEAALGGSLLIEEISSLSLPLQSLLVRLLSTEQAQPRLLVTTSVSLPDVICLGRFREDLYYRLAVLQATLPPLCERVEDVPALAAYLAGNAAPGRELMLAPETLACLKAYPWPGQVRELAAAMQHAVAVCPGPLVLPRHLPQAVAASIQSNAAGHLDEALSRALTIWLDQKLTGAEANDGPDYDSLLAHVESQMLAMLLRRFEDKPTHLAAALNMNRATLRRKLRDLLGRE